MDKVAFVFAGQGAQAVGMGKSLYERSKAARRIMETAEEIRPGTLHMCFEGNAAELSMTVNTQPCLYMVDYACAAALREAGVEPERVAGFSLGEVAAAAFAGMTSFEDGFRLVVKRAELMQECAQRQAGVMTAVLKLSVEKVAKICGMLEDAWPVNDNCPGQIVVACAQKSADDLAAQVRAEGGRTMQLNVGGAFHSPYMKRASEGLRVYLKDRPLKTPRIPIYANSTGRLYEGDINEAMAAQVASPVLWRQGVEKMKSDGTETFVEVGPGTTLCGLIRRIDESLSTYNVCDAESLDRCLDALKEATTC